MDRRHFLGLSAGLSAGAVGILSLAGCSSGGSSDLVLIPNDWEFFTGSSYRVAFLLARTTGNGAPLALTHPVTLRIGRQNGPLGPPMPTAIHADGPEPSYALTTYSFPSAGVYQLSATYQGSSVTLPISVIDPSSTRVPVVGQALPSVATPTVAQPIGVNPVCTANPPCPFHSVSLDAALAARRPIALLFATPALCQSRYCGPVLLNLQAVAGPWLNRVTFIHCEIYTDLSGQTNTPPVVAYNLEHEPMLYLAGADGIIKARIDNLFDKGEAAAALQAAFS